MECTVNLFAILDQAAARFPERGALYDGERRLCTWVELRDRALRIATAVRTQHAAGSRIAIASENCPEIVELMFSVWAAECVIVPINYKLHPREMVQILDDAGVSLVFASEKIAPGLADLTGVPIETLTAECLSRWSAAQPAVPPCTDASTLAWLFYTSGTTGFPKGAMTTHENFLSNSETCRRIMFLPPETHLKNLVSVPLFHVTGCNSQLIVTTQLNGTTVIMPAFEVQAFLRATVDEQINILTSVPAIFWLAMSQPNFHEFDVSNVRWVTYGGAPTAPDVIARLRASFPNARLGNGLSAPTCEVRCRQSAAPAPPRANAPPAPPRKSQRKKRPL